MHKLVNVHKLRSQIRLGVCVCVFSIAISFLLFDYWRLVQSQQGGKNISHFVTYWKAFKKYITIGSQYANLI